MSPELLYVPIVLCFKLCNKNRNFLLNDSVGVTAK